ncbi:cytochrome P450 [Stachybotrys elegans]|uniref:Cytochrome P450 n=1 Tax=Stachybotrys elegans TaxID=80388 RepID=A0A8K0SZ68_9HYPO|nr:cytochrome P450 [Stachybotrys elegans]
MELPPLILTGTAALIGYLVCTAVYRLYLSPLSKIPGPKLAALTTWYNAYYDVVLGGQYMFAVRDMHRKYGPVVRTRPDAVHVIDPSFIDVLYTQSPKHRRDRAWTIMGTMQLTGSMLSTSEHDLHRRRRASLNPYFSQQNVRRLEPVVSDTLAHLFRRMDGWAREGEPVQINAAFRAATKDIIQAYAFGESERYLDVEDCRRGFFEVLAPNRIAHLGTHAHWLVTLMTRMPTAIMTKIVPGVGFFKLYLESLQAQIEEIKKAKNATGTKTIFHDILSSDIPDSEKTTSRLTDEAAVIVIAGSETTASTLAALTYILLSDPALLARLKTELEDVMPDRYAPPPTASVLDGLPFLNAVIQETIRMYPGATHRQDRVAPDEDLVYESPDGKRRYVLPAGTTIGMAAPLVNRNPLVYDRPDEFLPDRYLENPGLRRHQIAFSKGGRQCLGMSLAYQELQTFAAGIFRRYELYDPAKTDQGPTLELYETTVRDIAMHSEYITPAVHPDSKGVRIRIRS